MRTRLPPAALVFAATTLLLLLAAVGRATLQVPAVLQAEFVDPNSVEVAAIRRTGETATNWLGARFVHEINRALSRGDSAASFAVSHLKTVSTASATLPGMPTVTAFKATSHRVINPANAPDAAEQLALDHVQRMLDRREPPGAVLVQKVRAETGALEWRVYRPLAVLPGCVACHGREDTQTPALRELIRQHFPNATATGYTAGEWRGLLRVTITPEAPPSGPDS